MSKVSKVPYLKPKVLYLSAPEYPAARPQATEKCPFTDKPSGPLYPIV